MITLNTNNPIRISALLEAAHSVGVSIKARRYVAGQPLTITCIEPFTEVLLIDRLEERGIQVARLNPFADEYQQEHENAQACLA